MTWEPDSDRIWKLQKKVKILKAHNNLLRRRLVQFKASLAKAVAAVREAEKQFEVLHAQVEEVKQFQQKIKRPRLWVWVLLAWLGLVINLFVVFLSR